MKLDIALRDIILVFTPILVVNIWTWFKNKASKKRDATVIRNIFINELLRIEAKIKTQINHVKSSLEKFHIEQHYFGWEPFNDTISWQPHSKILHAFTINSKSNEKRNKSFDELVIFTHLTNAFEVYTSLLLTTKELKDFIKENIRSEVLINKRWSTTYETLLQEILNLNEGISSGNLRINKNLQKRLSEALHELLPYLDFNSLDQNKSAIDSFFSTTSETERLLVLIPTLREMSGIMNEYQGVSDSVKEKLSFYSEFFDKASVLIREVADFLQQKTRVKKFWSIV